MGHRNGKSIVCLLLVLLMSVSVLTGCSKNDNVTLFSNAAIQSKQQYFLPEQGLRSSFEKINAQKFESSFYSNPDLRQVRPPEDTQPSIDVAALIQQLQKSPELATALAALLPHTS